MEYARIDKPQTGIISPSKLRMKLIGVSNLMKKDGSNCNSSRTSPSRIEDSEFVKNSLLASESEDFDDTYPTSVKVCGQAISSSVQNQNHCSPRENIDVHHAKVQQSSKDDSGNSSVVNPYKSNEDENLDYDSNASSSSFEFHKGERMERRALKRSLSRPTSYKWNDAEKWIVNKQASQANYSKSFNAQSGGKHLLGMNVVRRAPDGASDDYRLPLRALDTKRIDSCQPLAHMMSLETSDIPHPGVEPVRVQSNGENGLIDLYPQSKDMKEVVNVKNAAHDVTGTPGIRAISMRDMGTEMTPATSQGTSRTATPVRATSPLRSPTSSIPSTPRRGEPTTTPMERAADSNSRNLITEKGDKHLSEQELKLKTRREIVALGVQLGKMNIAAWASTDEKGGNNPSSMEITDPDELERIEFEKRAAAWEDAEKSKHAARYKSEEIKIQAWESQQKAKLEEELRRIEMKVEQLRAQSKAKMMKKIAMARKISEDKRAAAEARKKRQAEKTAAQAEYIRQTGRMPSSDYICCGFFL